MSPISATSPTAVSVSMPRRQRSRATIGAHGPRRGLLGDQSVQPIAAGEQHLVVSEVLAEDDLDQRLIKTDRCSATAGGA